MFIKNNSFKNHAKKYHSYYINRFMGLKCAPDLLKIGVFPNAKEITESFGAFEACKLLGIERGDPNITVVCVGDGHKPRTAALCAFMSNWNCISVDPEFNKTAFPVKRLTCHKAKIEDVRIEAERVIILLVHSHARIPACLESIRASNRDLISIPCCFPDAFNGLDTTYEDENIWSEKNRVNIYRSI